MRFGMIFLAAAWPAAVWAECPTAADLDNGIRFRIDQADTETFRRVRPGVVEATIRFEDGYATRNLLAQGIYLLEWVDLVDEQPDLSTRATFAFPKNALDMPIPETGGAYRFDVVVAENGNFDKELQAYDVGEMVKYQYGTCVYDVLPIEVRYVPDEENSVDILHYLPALGIAYFAESLFGTDEREVYRYHTIEKLP